jgi:hypothetical protein
MYPNLDFWFENKPSGNPVRKENNVPTGTYKNVEELYA